MTDVVRTSVPENSVEEQWDLDALQRQLHEEWQLEIDLKSQVEGSESLTDEDLVEQVVQAADASFADKLERVGAEQFMPFIRMVLLQSIDHHWREHLAALDYLRQGIHLRGYAQKNPEAGIQARGLRAVQPAARCGQGRCDARADDGAHPEPGRGRARRRGDRAARRRDEQRDLHPPQRRWQRCHRECGRGRRCRRARFRRSDATIRAHAAAARNTSSATGGWPERQGHSARPFDRTGIHAMPVNLASTAS